VYINAQLLQKTAMEIIHHRVSTIREYRVSFFRLRVLVVFVVVASESGLVSLISLGICGFWPCALFAGDLGYAH